MAAFNGENAYVIGTRVIIRGRTIGTIVAVAARDYGEGMKPLGTYAIDIAQGTENVNIIQAHHWELTPDEFVADRCSDCGEAIPQEDAGGVMLATVETAEVVNKATGAHSIQHVDCFAAHDGCCYDLA